MISLKRLVNNNQILNQFIRVINSNNRNKSSLHRHEKVIDNSNHTIRSPFSDVKLSELTLTEYVFRFADQRKQLPALTDALTGRRYNYGQLKDATERFSATLLEKTNLKSGDVLSLVLPNCPEFAILFLAAAAAGIIISPTNPLYTAEELWRQFSDSDCHTVVTIPLLFDRVRDAFKLVKGGGQIIVMGTEAEENELCKKYSDVISFQSLMKHVPSRNSLPKRPDIDMIAALPYSSGTTGMPKGVCITHRNLVANMCQMEHPGMLPPKMDTQEVCLGILPFFHIYGLNGVMNVNLSMGRHTITLPKFDPNLFITAMTKYKPTQMSIVPPLLAFMASTEHINSEALSRLRSVVSGAAAATLPVIKAFINKLNSNDLDFRQGYGMTETSCVAIFTPPNCDVNKIGSAGTPISLTEIKIVDENGNALPQGQSGELLIRGPQVMQGYHNNDEATKEMLTEDGWLKTGDVAYVDEEGYVFIVDRLKELIKVKGLQVSPTELEGVIRKMEGIADAAVVGIPDERSGEVPRAYIVRATNSNITENDIIKYVDQRVAPFKSLAGGVKFVEAIPKNAAGKIERKIIKHWK